jgi:hypothetical protein
MSGLLRSAANAPQQISHGDRAQAKNALARRFAAGTVRTLKRPEDRAPHHHHCRIFS